MPWALALPKYAHLPVALNEHGQKLSKQTHATSLSRTPPGRILCQGLRFLGQKPPSGLSSESPATVLKWATDAWSMAQVPRVTGIELV